MTIIRIFKYALKNIFRNTFLTFTSLLILTLLMFFINLLVLLHAVSFHLVSNINEKLTVSLYVKDEYSNTSGKMIDFLKDVDRVLPNVVVRYSSHDEVLGYASEKFPGISTILQGSDVLPDTIRLSNIKLQEFDKLDAVIERSSYLFSDNEDNDYSLATYKNQYIAINKVVEKIQQGRYLLYGFILIYVLSIMIIVYVVVGNFIFYYRDEIYTTRLVGGSKAFIYGPFSLQGMLYTGIAYFISVGIFFIFLKNIQYIGIEGFSYALELTQVENIMLIGAFPLFLFIGLLAGWLSSRKYLK